MPWTLIATFQAKAGTYKGNWFRKIEGKDQDRFDSEEDATALQPFVADLRKRWPVVLDKRFVNDKEVEDHSALVPTETPARNLKGDRLKIYDLIARRFLAAFFPDRIEGRTTIITKIGKESFKTTGTVVQDPGWSAVDPPHSRPKKGKANTEGPEAEEDSCLPAVVKAEAVDTMDLVCRAGR
jgi:DNA topoisomerase III